MPGRHSFKRERPPLTQRAAHPPAQIPIGHAGQTTLAQEDKKGPAARGNRCRMPPVQIPKWNSKFGTRREIASEISWNKRLNWCRTASDRNAAPGNPSPAPGCLPHGRLTKTFRRLLTRRAHITVSHSHRTASAITRSGVSGPMPITKARTTSGPQVAPSLVCTHAPMNEPSCW